MSSDFRLLLRNLRRINEHCKEVERVAAELSKRGLLDLADDLRLSLRLLPLPAVFIKRAYANHTKGGKSK